LGTNAVCDVIQVSLRVPQHGNNAKDRFATKVFHRLANVNTCTDLDPISTTPNLTSASTIQQTSRSTEPHSVDRVGHFTLQ